MAPSTIRKALGTVKDQTSIGIAKVSSNIAPELDVVIVKATSHDDDPAEERHIREILNLTSSSRGYVSACIAAVSKRLGKTRDWIVALKTLMLVHRLLADGDPSFHFEIFYATRKGTRLLNMSDFRDEAHSSSWDHSAFVRTYALYLDQRLEMVVSEQKERGGARADSSRGRYETDFGERDSYGGSGRGYGRSPNGDKYEDRYNYKSPDRYSYKSPNRASEEKKPQTPLRDMKPEKILAKMHQLQLLLDRFLALRPTGIAKNSRMILIALYPIVRDSFQLYADICEILAVLLDRFFDMEYPDCVKSFEAYASAAKQIDELSAFYSWCKDVGVARSSEFPEVQRITDKLLETLEEFMKDRAKKPVETPKELEPAPEPPIKEEEPAEDMNAIKALPAPADFEPEPQPPEVKVPEPKKQEEGDLLNLREGSMSAVDHENRLALALFSAGGATSASNNGTWEAFPSDNNTVTSAWQNPAAEKGKADWELALVETASHLSNQKASLPGGLDPLILNGMYDHGMVKQHMTAQASSGSASSVALPGKGKTQVLALPAPDGTVQNINEDPFAASAAIPPPSYVQMSDMEKKQQMLMQEQMMWQQYAQNGMQGQTGLNRVGNGYGQYGMPPVNGGAGYYYPPY